MKNHVSLLRGLVAGLLLVSSLPIAYAQWSWKDGDGRRIFSDQPPPSSVPDKDILKRPGPRSVSSGSTEPTASAPTPSVSITAAAPKISGKDTELEKRKSEAKAKEAQTKKADEAKALAAKAENCERAKRAKASFDSGTRIATTNSRGEREIMSDSVRASETKRLQDIIASDCS